jgi:hypothetical protein
VPPASLVPSRWVRSGVHCFLAVFVLTGLLHLELFPFSAFRLFSELRPAERQSWQLRAVDSEGAEHRLDLAELPLAYRNSTRLLLDFPDLDPTERDAICDGWAAHGRAAGDDIVQVHVYAVTESVRPDGPAPQRDLAYVCGTSP